MRENLHQSNPPIITVVRPKIRLRPNPDRDGDSVAVTVGVPVGGGGGMDGLGEGVIVGGLGVSVGVAGGVTRRSNFCSGRITEVLPSPFQAIRSESGTSYRLAIQKSVSPLWTVW